MNELTPTGRKTILTQELQDDIVQAIKSGNYLDDAAQYAGVAERTVYQWLQKGRTARNNLEEGIEPSANELLFMQFVQAVETARSQAVVRNLTIIQRAANEGHWQAAAWYLERTNPKKWGRHETVELTGKDGGPVIVEESSREVLREKLEAMRDRARTIIDVQSNEDPPALRVAK